jgi:hypothetical protein
MLRHRLRTFVWLLLAALLVTSAAEAKGPVHVRGYTRKDGTYVRPHYRSAPDGNFWNNWSTIGNVNPITGQPGTKTRPPANYGRDVHVRGYTRSDGTSVQSHFRSNPDGDPSNNWSADGNVNPYTGKPGSKVADRSTSLRAPVTPGYRSKWATDGLPAEDKVEHARIAQFIKSHGQNLVYWDLYTLDQLREIETKILASGH